MVTSTRLPVMQPPQEVTEKLPASKRFNWPDTPTKPEAVSTTDAEGNPLSAEQARRDRLSAVVAVAIFVAFVTFIVWLAAQGTPSGYDPSWDYHYLY